MRFSAQTTIKDIQRFENVNIHRPTNNVPDERIGAVVINGETKIGVIEFCRMVLVQDDEGKLYQWFGKGSTKFWQDNFSSNNDAPVGIGDTIQLSASIKCVKPADQHYGERSVIQHPKRG